MILKSISRWSSSSVTITKHISHHYPSSLKSKRLFYSSLINSTDIHKFSILKSSSIPTTLLFIQNHTKSVFILQRHSHSISSYNRQSVKYNKPNHHLKNGAKSIGDRHQKHENQVARQAQASSLKNQDSDVLNSVKRQLKNPALKTTLETFGLLETFEHHEKQFIEDFTKDRVPKLRKSEIFEYLKFNKLILQNQNENNDKSAEKGSTNSSSYSSLNNLVFPALVDYLVSRSPDRPKQLHVLAEKSSLKSPHLWFPETRKMKRKFIMHVGPTNSGKTHNAMERFKSAKSGVYCGPLRLLAHEIYVRLNQSDIPCNLLTGEEQRITEDVNLFSCTVEMVDFQKKFDVAIIDEIQMIADVERGSSWTSAVLGVKAKEVHLCGEPSAIPIIKNIAEITGDSIEIHEYNRLSPLRVEKSDLQNDLKNITNGDCVIAFSRKDLFKLKKDIEKTKNMKCGIVYGGLPPEVRAEQARLFNDPNGDYKVLVATDAIGMGLNLNIQRVIFNSTIKMGAPLTISEIKQIAGRAGRFGSSHPVGYVNGMNYRTLKYVQDSIHENVPAIKSAGLFPLYNQVEEFYNFVPEVSFSRMLDVFEYLADIDGNYFLCETIRKKATADIIEEFPLSLKDRYSLVQAPVKLNQLDSIHALRYFAYHRAHQIPVSLYEIIELPNVVPDNTMDLSHLESMHSVIILYLWLSSRMSETFTETETALLLKEKCENMIQKTLVNLHRRKHSSNQQQKSNNRTLSLGQNKEFNHPKQRKSLSNGNPFLRIKAL